MNDAALQGHSDRFRAIGYPELAEEIPHMHFDRILGNGQLPADFLVALTPRHQGRISDVTIRWMAAVNAAIELVLGSPTGEVSAECAP
jgi:hypothetical protein